MSSDITAGAGAGRRELVPCLGMRPEPAPEIPTNTDSVPDDVCIAEEKGVCASNFHCNLLLVFLHVVFFLVNDAANGLRTRNPRSSDGHGRGKAPSERAGRRHTPYKPAQPRRGGRWGKAGAKGAGERQGSIATGNSKQPGGAAAGDERLLACPCFKYNPILHLTCLTRNRLTDTAFVVQHLERGHPREPIHCPVCGVMFGTRDECHVHIRLMTCERRTFSYEGITEDQLRRLRENRRAFNEIERWYCIWDIMYPNTPRPDSPYVGSLMEECISIGRRALRAARQNLFGADPVADLLAAYEASLGPSQSYGMAQLGGRISDTIEERVLSWSHIRSVIPNRDDLSFLTSDRPVIFEPALPGAGGGGTNPPPPQHSLPPLQPLMPDDPAAGLLHASDGSPGFPTHPSFSSDLASFPHYSDEFSSPTLSFFDLGHATTHELTELTSLLAEDAVPSSASTVETGDNSKLSRHAGNDGAEDGAPT